MILLCFFFFKQKTAYEMRISDWSSDVCSSDLAGGIWARVRIEDVATPEAFARDPARVHEFYNARRRGLLNPNVQPNAAHAALARLEREWPGPLLLVTQNIDDLHARSEEHTSELQSLMRTSYAVFCLKKQNK